MNQAKKIEYDGHNYIVHHMYSENDYGYKSVYHVLTNNQKWCGSIIAELCGYPNVESKGEHELNYKRNPSMLTALKPYYTVDFREDDMYEKHYDLEELVKDFPVDLDSYYKLVYIEPYDD